MRHFLPKPDIFGHTYINESAFWSLSMLLRLAWLNVFSVETTPETIVAGNVWLDDCMTYRCNQPCNHLASVHYSMRTNLRTSCLRTSASSLTRSIRCVPGCVPSLLTRPQFNSLAAHSAAPFATDLRTLAVTNALPLCPTRRARLPPISPSIIASPLSVPLSDGYRNHLALPIPVHCHTQPPAV